ncbi:MAG TPA: hypothetical protein VK736_08780, partial [Candidatus Binatia bacterium]|nr:hypothetical protein [Candidatus Binatia bacterium]
MLQFLIGPFRVGRTIGTRTSTRRPPRTTPSVIVLPMRTSEIGWLSTDTSQTLVPLAETMMSLEGGLALELPEQSPCGYEHELSTPGASVTGDALLTLVSLVGIEPVLT